MKITTIFKLILALPFLIIALIALNIIESKGLQSYNTSFISIALTIATFSISFSFLQYQFSPYKALLKSISKRQLLFSYGTIFIALSPLLTLFFRAHAVPLVSLFVIPLLAYMTILLWIIASEESNPLFLLNKMMSPKKQRRFINRFIKATNIFKVHQINLDLSKRNEKPMHDLTDSRYEPIQVKNDPFNFINNTIEIALKSSDIETFEKAIDIFLSIIESMPSNRLVIKNDFKHKFEKLINISFKRLSYSISQLTDNNIYHSRFLEKIGTYLKLRALDNKQTNELSLHLIEGLTSFTINTISKKNIDNTIFVTSLYRQLAQKGIYNDPKDKADFMFDLHLPFICYQIKIIGQETIKIKHSNLLYRCLEELGYLGCTAIKANHFHVGVECLQSLVQLGREARANSIKCFETHCLLETIDHADERIWWMLSWVRHHDQKSIEQWIDSFETAYSRLHGFKRRILFDYDEKCTFSFADSKEPYIESFSKDHYRREIDYSDFSDVKEFRLY